MDVCPVVSSERGCQQNEYVHASAQRGAHPSCMAAASGSLLMHVWQPAAECEEQPESVIRAAGRSTTKFRRVPRSKQQNAHMADGVRCLCSYTDSASSATGALVATIPSSVNRSSGMSSYLPPRRVHGEHHHHHHDSGSLALCWSHCYYEFY